MAIRVVLLVLDPSLFDVLEDVHGESSVASVVLGVAVNDLLVGELDVVVVVGSYLYLDGLGHRERVTRIALLLSVVYVFDVRLPGDLGRKRIDGSIGVLLQNLSVESDHVCKVLLSLKELLLRSKQTGFVERVVSFAMFLHFPLPLLGEARLDLLLGLE